MVVYPPLPPDVFINTVPLGTLLVLLAAPAIQLNRTTPSACPCIGCDGAEMIFDSFFCIESRPKLHSGADASFLF